MTLNAAGTPQPPLGYLFSPASTYPQPVAYAVDRAGEILHTWSHNAGQPLPQDDPPNYLRGWNHVEMDRTGSLLAVVPLHALLKLAPDSTLEWSCPVAAHHDLAIASDGAILVLTEKPRLITASPVTHVILDNLITTVSAGGTVTAEMSLWDVLRTDDGLRQRIDNVLVGRATAFQLRGWPARADGVSDELVAETLAVLATGTFSGEQRRASQLLRALPNSPCDILHTNTLELLAAHPQGLWQAGDVLVCMRELDTVAVINMAQQQVCWWWGPGQISGPHQPTLLANGHLSIFDNGRDEQRTRIVILDPATHKITWSWAARPPESFFCPLAGGCEQLPNGNLLVTNSTQGAAFELTTNGDVVWRLELPASVFGAGKGRVSIYRMAAVDASVLRQTRTGFTLPPDAAVGRHDEATRTLAGTR